jgi:lipoprotein-releasing system permease protein
MAAIAIAVSFFIIIVAVAVSAGFRNVIRDGVAAMTGDVRIQPYVSGTGEDPVSMPAQLPSQEKLLALPGVVGIEPVAVRAGIVKNGDIIHGVVVKGIPGQAGNDVMAGPDRPSLSVSIPHRLSEITGLGIGDDMVTYFVGEKVRVRKFHITAIHRDLVEVDDNLLVYANLADIQRLNGWDEGQVSCLDVTLNEQASRKELAGAIGHILATSGHEQEDGLYVTSSEDSYQQIFDWLTLLDFNVLVILVLMTVVAGFNMVSGLLIMLLRNIPTIGTLKTLGMSDGAIGRLFIRIGARAVLKGMLIGNALALLFCLVQGTTHLIPLDPANYFVSWVPVHINLLWVILADAAAFAGILALLWLPSRVVASIDPAKTVKAD